MHSASSLRPLLIAGSISLLAASSAYAQYINWSSTTATENWLTGSNWTGSDPAGDPTTTTNTDGAGFGTGDSTTINLNMTTTSGNYYLGVIDHWGGNARIIQNTSGTTGVLTLNGYNATLGGSSNVVIRNGTTTLLTIGSSGSGTLGLNFANATANNIRIDSTGGITINSVISGSNGFNKEGTGTGVLILGGSGANTNNGTTTVSTGTLILQKDDNVIAVAGNLVVKNAATFTTTNGATFRQNQIADTASITFEAGSILSARMVDTVGAVNVTGGINGGKFNLGSNSNFVMSSLTLNSTGKEPIPVINDYSLAANSANSTMTVGTGGLTMNNAFYYIHQDGLAVAFTAKLILNGNFTSTGTSQLFKGTRGTAELELGTVRTFDITGTMGIAPVITGASGGIDKTGTGTLTLSATNTYGGGTTVSNGTLTLGHATDTLSNTGAVNVNGGTLALGTNSDTVGAVTLTSGSITGSTGVLTGSSYAVQSGSVSAILGGSGGLTKTTGGTVTLTGANTYTGATLVSAGTLRIHGSTSANSNFTVDNGGTLGGSGTIGGTVTLNAGSTLAPGASIESLATGSNVWNGGSTYEFEFSTDGSTGAAGAQWDLLAITGTLDLSGASSSNQITFDLVSMLDATNSGSLASWDPNANTTWAGIVTTTGGITGFAANLFTFDTSGFQNTLNGTFNISQNGNNLNLNYVTNYVIPEPKAALLGAIGVLLLFRRRR